MRIAVVSDVHGNALALDAVMTDLRREAIDQIVCLGDAVQGGAQPAAVVARLREAALPVVMGNADAWLVTGRQTGAEAPPAAWMRAVREWSLTQLSEADRRFVAGFPPVVEFALPAGKTLRCGHGSPRSFDDVIRPETSDAEASALLGPLDVAIICGGHTHQQQIRRLGETLFFNPVSVGLPFRRDTGEHPPPIFPWAEYAVLTVDSDGRERLEFRRASYDIGELCATIEGSGIPEPSRLTARYRPI
jgi:predicted phosphodiesterase